MHSQAYTLDEHTQLFIGAHIKSANFRIDRRSFENVGDRLQSEILFALMVPRKIKRRERKTLEDEIADTEKRDQHEPVGISISVTRGLFLHALLAMRDGDYGSVS